MKKRLISYFPLFLFFLNACTMSPRAKIDCPDPMAEVDEKVYFTNRSLYSDKSHWDFGDGTFSTEDLPSKVYQNSGDYKVTFTAYSKNEKKSDKAYCNIRVAAQNEKFVGEYSGSACGNANSISIFPGNSQNEIFIDNMWNSRIKAVISGNNFTIPLQTVNNGERDYTIYGNGELKGGISLSATIELEYMGTYSGTISNVTCHMFVYKI